MDIQYHGANCISITTKQARVIVDDNLADLGKKSVAKKDDVLLFTGAHPINTEARLLVDRPGEYEVALISILGIPSRSHLDEQGGSSATMYKLMIDDQNILIVGHVYPDLSDAQLEMIGMIDMMFVPVGGNGYTLDATGALKLIKKVEPKIVVPTHYADDDLSYPVPQQQLEDALKQLSMEATEKIAHFKPKPESFTEGLTKLVILEG